MGSVSRESSARQGTDSARQLRLRSVLTLTLTAPASHGRY